MKKSFCKASLIVAISILILGCSVSERPVHKTSRATPQLFTLEPTPSRETLQANATGELATVLANLANAEVTFVKIDPDAVSPQRQDLQVDLPGGKTVQFHLRDFTPITPDIVGWVGYRPSAWKTAHPGSSSEIAIDPRFYLSLVRKGNTVLGDLIVEGQRYRIQPMGPEKNALIKVDESILPPEAEPLVRPGPEAKVSEKAASGDAAHSVIRVMFLATRQMKALNPNYKEGLALALNNANQYMKNSDVQITYELAGFYDGDYDETGRNYLQQLNDMRLAKPFADQVLARREALQADLVSMFSTNPQYCGMAWLTAKKEQAHSVISCSQSLAHELGHNLGVNHGWKEGDAVRDPPYMHGYKHVAAPAFHTIMIGTHGSIPFFSNPRLQHEGVPMGTTDHHDAARRFNERRKIVEHFYP